MSSPPESPPEIAPTDVTSRIRVLPDALVNRIAAGEVVERPASVIKELVENALDAGATRIEVLASAGGRSLRVADNGAGMSAEDATRAFLNHATSKLRDDDDLTCIHTLGFRGEALASIAAVARITCETRQAHSPLGTRIRLSGTDPKPRIEPTGCAPGTVMEVADLFYNAPARLKFLKKPATELAAIEELMEALAIAHPAVRITLTVNDRQTLATNGQGDLRQTLGAALSLGDETQALLPVAFQDADQGLGFEGFISPPTHLKHARRWLLTYVNGRLVRCSLLAKAIETAYASLAPSGRFPYGALFLTLPLPEVDINVHPAKREVRYAQPNTVFSFVRQAVARALECAGVSAMLAPMPLPDALTHAWPGPEASGLAHGPTARAWASPGTGPVAGGGSSGPSLRRDGLDGPSTRQASLDFYRPLSPNTLNPPSGNPSGASDALAPEGAAFHVIGQLFNTYILLETPQGLMVVDQHIAAERAAFEALKTHALADADQCQRRLMDIALPLNPARRALLLEHQDTLADLGYAFTSHEDGMLHVSGIPALDADRLDPLAALEALLAHLEATGEPLLDRDNLIATMACHSAIRAGDVLSHEAMTRIIARWLACRLPWTCPHGRPIAHTIRAEELNRFFDRPSLPGLA